NGDQYSANDRRQREPPKDFEFDIDPECEEDRQQEHSSNEPLLNTLLRVPEIDWCVKKSVHRAPTPGNQRLPFTMSPRLCRHRLRCPTRRILYRPLRYVLSRTPSISVFRESWENMANAHHVPGRRRHHACHAPRRGIGTAVIHRLSISPLDTSTIARHTRDRRQIKR